MEAVRNTALRATILEGFIARHQPDRKIDEPWHVSDLITCPRQAFWNRVDPLPPTYRMALLFMTGKGLGHLLTGGEPEQEFIIDGIICHPDYILGTVPWEIKTTRKKIDGDALKILSMETWMEQILCYMKALGVQKFELVELGLMGDYKPPFPDLEVWELTATQEEIEENWAIMGMRKALLDEARMEWKAEEDYSLPMSSRLNNKNQRWECRECVYSLRCYSEEE